MNNIDRILEELKEELKEFKENKCKRSFAVKKVGFVESSMVVEPEFDNIDYCDMDDLVFVAVDDKSIPLSLMDAINLRDCLNNIIEDFLLNEFRKGHSAITNE